MYEAPVNGKGQFLGSVVRIAGDGHVVIAGGTRDSSAGFTNHGYFGGPSAGVEQMFLFYC